MLGTDVVLLSSGLGSGRLSDSAGGSERGRVRSRRFDHRLEAVEEGVDPLEPSVGADKFGFGDAIEPNAGLD